MKKILAFLVLAITALAFSATNYKLPGSLIQPSGVSNDKPFYKWKSARTFANADTVFGRIDTATAATSNRYAFTSYFNSQRDPFFTEGASLPSPTSVVALNPDSVVCKAVIISLGADSVSGSFGIYDSLGTSWSTYGGPVTAFSTIDISGKITIRSAIPWTSDAAFRPWITLTTTTDTATVSYLDCKDK